MKSSHSFITSVFVSLIVCFAGNCGAVPVSSSSSSNDHIYRELSCIQEKTGTRRGPMGVERTRCSHTGPLPVAIWNNLNTFSSHVNRSLNELVGNNARTCDQSQDDACKHQQSHKHHLKMSDSLIIGRLVAHSRSIFDNIKFLENDVVVAAVKVKFSNLACTLLGATAHISDHVKVEDTEPVDIVESVQMDRHTLVCSVRKFLSALRCMIDNNWSPSGKLRMGKTCRCLLQNMF